MTRTVPARSPQIDSRPAAKPVPASKRRVGLLGTGYIADWHAKALASVPGVALVAVCDALLPRAEAFARRFGVPAAFGSLDAMLASGSLDAVHVLLPPDLHFGAAERFVDAGIDVLLEKPMCTRAEDCEALVRRAEKRGVRLGVGHNFLFSEPYRRLRRDLRDGLLGPIHEVVITWHRELPQVTHGPFDAWMLREPGNVALEIGSHSVAHMLDLVGRPNQLRAWADDPVELPTGRTFHRRWSIDARCGRTAVELRFSFVPGFEEHLVHVRGALGSATADLLRDTYVLRHHRPVGDDFDRWAMIRAEARDLRRQSGRTLGRYLLSKLHLHPRGAPYGASIAGVLDAFHAPRPLDERIRGASGTEVIRVCEEVRRAAAVDPGGDQRTASTVAPLVPVAPAPRILVLGATGFIGRELVRQLASSGRPVRVLARSPSKLPPDLRTSLVEPVRGDLGSEADLRRAFQGIDCAYHLARSNARTWAEYQRDEIETTRRVAEAALEAGVKRFVYTGTIDSYYAGAGAGTITEGTPLDPRIARRNLYARAKAVSEEILAGMHRTRGLPLVVFRPGIVIGRGASPFHWGVGMWWHGSVCQVWGRGENPLPLVLVEDVARALVAALDAPGLEGESFNLVADPCLTAQDYLDALDRHGSFRIRRQPTPVARFYATDLAKWLVKVAVRHPDRRFPSWRDWESRTQRARFDCTRAKVRLGWRPVSDRQTLIRRGIEEPLDDLLR
jgi:predicted dehydrogenase/nucleoside-diphosphate-sugar epimerase